MSHYKYKWFVLIAGLIFGLLSFDAVSVGSYQRVIFKDYDAFAFPIPHGTPGVFMTANVYSKDKLSATWAVRAWPPDPTCTTNFWWTECTAIRSPRRYQQHNRSLGATGKILSSKPNNY